MIDRLSALLCLGCVLGPTAALPQGAPIDKMASPNDAIVVKFFGGTASGPAFARIEQLDQIVVERLDLGVVTTVAQNRRARLAVGKIEPCTSSCQCNHFVVSLTGEQAVPVGSTSGNWQAI